MFCSKCCCMSERRLKSRVLQLMSSSPATVDIASLKVVKISSSSEASQSTAAIITLNISHFDPPRDGFVIIYIVRAPSRRSSISSSGLHGSDGDDDDEEAPNDSGSPAFIDAVTYPGESSIPLVPQFSSSSKITVAMYVVAFDTGSRVRHVCFCYNGNACNLFPHWHHHNTTSHERFSPSFR